jgi:tRNA(adenine34) deaminase
VQLPVYGVTRPPGAEVVLTRRTRGGHARRADAGGSGRDSARDTVTFVDDERFMEAAIEQARLALMAGEVPIGAVLVVGDAIVARAYNQPIAACDPTAHAEVLVLRAAAQALGNYRLTDAVVYVTVEPCLMCVGALVHARVREVVYGAAEPKTGAIESTVRALESPRLNHRFAVRAGVQADACRELVRQFFRERRLAQKGRPPLAEGEPRDV